MIYLKMAEPGRFLSGVYDLNCILQIRRGKNVLPIVIIFIFGESSVGVKFLNMGDSITMDICF